MGSNTLSSSVNKDVLIKKLGFIQFSNTTIFKKEIYLFNLILLKIVIVGLV